MCENDCCWFYHRWKQSSMRERREGNWLLEGSYCNGVPPSALCIPRTFIHRIRAQLREHTTRATCFHHKRLLERSFLRFAANMLLQIVWVCLHMHRWRAWYLYRRECRAHACQILVKAKMRIAFHLWQKFIQHKQELMWVIINHNQFVCHFIIHHVIPEEHFRPGVSTSTTTIWRNSV